MRTPSLLINLLLGTGMYTQNTSPSVLLFFDQQRFIFNAGEATMKKAFRFDGFDVNDSMVSHLFDKQSLKQRSEDNFQESLGTKSKYEKRLFAQIV